MIIKTPITCGIYFENIRRNLEKNVQMNRYPKWDKRIKIIKENYRNKSEDVYSHSLWIHHQSMMVFRHPA